VSNLIAPDSVAVCGSLVLFLLRCSIIAGCIDAVCLGPVEFLCSGLSPSPATGSAVTELTALIQRARAGDSAADKAAFDLLYGDLRRLARSRLARGGRNTLLDTTSLVNEAYLRLARADGLSPEDRNGYLAYASRAMRSVIVDFVRARGAARRGGGAQHVTLNTEVADGVPADEAQILRVHEALDELASVDGRMVQVVEMRYFAGLTEQEVAAALGVTDRTVRRDWNKARLMLAAALK
jgi:RNA polymerase sigma factor (TIGR02999 family)